MLQNSKRKKIRNTYKKIKTNKNLKEITFHRMNKNVEKFNNYNKNKLKRN